MTEREASQRHEALIAWERLSSDRQIRLRIEYGRHLDSLPPTCSLEEKNRRFARWLAERGVFYRGK